MALQKRVEERLVEARLPRAGEAGVLAAPDGGAGQARGAEEPEARADHDPAAPATRTHVPVLPSDSSGALQVPPAPDAARSTNQWPSWSFRPPTTTRGQRGDRDGRSEAQPERGRREGREGARPGAAGGGHADREGVRPGRADEARATRARSRSRRSPPAPCRSTSRSASAASRAAASSRSSARSPPARRRSSTTSSPRPRRAAASAPSSTPSTRSIPSTRGRSASTPTSC